MSSRNYQQNILMLQMWISISIEICFCLNDISSPPLLSPHFFDARYGSETAINEEVITLKTRHTVPTSLICSLTRWLMNRQKTDLCDVLY